MSNDAILAFQKYLKCYATPDEVLCRFQAKETEQIEKKELLKLAHLYEHICALELSERMDKNLYIWDDYPIDLKDLISFPYEDIGIDLIDEKISYLGQVKYYKKGSRVEAEHIKQSMLCLYFLLRKNKTTAEKMEFITPSDVSLSYGKMKYQEDISHQFIDYPIIEKWIRKAFDFKAPKIEKEFELRKCQIEALKIINKKWGDDIKIEMSCGSGKTDLICHVISEREEERFIILVPRLILLEQWSKKLSQYEIEHSCCGTGYEVDLESHVILCVYNSYDKLVDCQVNYLIVDEAHHIEGENEDVEDSDVEDSDVEDSDEEDDETIDEEEDNEEDKMTYLKLIAKKSKKIPTIHLSATLSGEDIDYRYSLEEGIKDDILCDYQIHLPVFTTGSYKHPLIEYINQHPEFCSILAYCSRIDRAVEFTNLLVENGIPSACLTSRTGKVERQKIIRDFRKKSLRVIVSISILGEGIDLPYADSCVFVDRRSSHYFIIQCIGRIIRKFKGKQMAHVILPMSENEVDREVDKFLKIISARDSRVKKIIGDRKVSNRIRIDGLNEIETEEATFLYERVIDRTRLDVDDRVEKIRRYYDENGKLPAKSSKDEVIRKLGKFIDRHLINYKNEKKYNQELISFIEKVSPRRLKKRIINDYISLIREYYDENGKLPAKSSKDEVIRKLGKFIDHQLTVYRNGKKYNQELVDFVEQIDNERLKKKENITHEEKLSMIRGYYDQNEKLPSRHGRDEQIKKLAYFIDRQLTNYKNRKKYYEPLIEFLLEVSPDRFPKIDK